MPDLHRRRGRGACLRIRPPPSLGPAEPWQPDQDRRAAIARVLPLWPHELGDTSQVGRHRILAKLRRALRAERRNGVGGHWSYDLARHVELLRVYRRELAALRSPSELEAQPEHSGSEMPSP